MNARDLAMVETYEAARPAWQASGKSPSEGLTAEQYAGGLVKLAGSLPAALVRWEKGPKHVAPITEAGEQWTRGVSRVLTEATSSSSSSTAGGLCHTKPQPMTHRAKPSPLPAGLTPSGDSPANGQLSTHRPRSNA